MTNLFGAFGSDHKRQVALACCLCRGSKQLRHEVPLEVDPAEWAKQVILNACPLCKGTGEQPFLRFKGKATPIAVFFIKARLPGKILAACIAPGCPKWADASVFFNSGQVTESAPIARCPDGHGIRMNITLDGIRRN